MDTINLNDLDWTTPADFDPSSNIYSRKIATVKGTELTLEFDLNFQEARLVMENCHGTWSGDASTEKDHPKFDQTFGRLHWRQFLTNWENEQQEKCQKELETTCEAMENELRSDNQSNRYRW